MTLTQHNARAAVRSRLPRLLLSLALGLGSLAAPTRGEAAPDPRGAAAALLTTPLDVLGDVLGAAGMISAGLTATAADLISLIDRNRLSRHVLHGIPSRGVHFVAYGLSYAGTSGLELLRWEDIERLPEPRTAYVDAVRFAGRLDTAWGGAEALGLAVRDAVSGPTLALLRAGGASAWGDSVARWRSDARIRALGPSPLAR